MARKQNNKIALVFLAILMIIYLTACESDEDSAKETSSNIASADSENTEGKTVEASSGKIAMPNSTTDYIGSEWTIETLTEYFKELGFNNIRAVACKPDDDDYENNIQEITIETGLLSDDPWEAGDEFAADAEITIYYNEFPVLTINNCPDLEKVLTSKNMNYMSFAEEYDERYVKFEAYVANHYNSIIDVTGGDYDGVSELGHYDEEYYNGLLIRIGDRSWDNNLDKSVKEGQNVTVSGKIDASWSEYYKQLYVEGLSLTKR